MLNNKQIDGAKATGKPFKLTDIDGLYLYVSSAGAKSWRYNYKAAGKQQTKTYGRYPLLGIAEARRLHHAFKYSLGGGDGETFRTVAEKWMRKHLPTLKNSKHQLQIAGTLEQFIFPVFGDEQIAKIKRREIVAAVQAIDARGTHETAHRVAGRVKQVFDYAIDLGEIDSNPATGLSRVLTKPVRTPMKALPLSAIPKLLADIETYDEVVTRLGLKLLAHTAVRTRELTQARWAEFNLDKAVWLVPAERMKLGLPHVVPLSTHVLEILAQLRQITGDSAFVVESQIRRGRPVSENTLLFALYRLGYRGLMTGHGFRTVASSALNESGLWSPSAIERQLAHKETDQVRAAYNRAEYLEERTRMMQWWSDRLVALAQ